MEESLDAAARNLSDRGMVREMVTYWKNDGTFSRLSATSAG